MTDNEIIKALECCKAGLPVNCIDCPEKRNASCIEKLTGNALDLIKRQQSEIDRLKKTNHLFEYAAKSVHQYIEDGKIYYLEFVNEECEAEVISRKIDYLCNIQDIRAEAIKEFADKLEANIGDEDFYVQDKLLLMSMIDNLAKEMGCGNA